MAIAEWANVAKIFKGYVTVGSDSDSNKIQHLVSVDLRMDGGYQVHYSTDGEKQVVSTGDRSNYVLRIDDSTDMYSSGGLMKKVVDAINKQFPTASDKITFRGVEIGAGSTKITYTITGFPVAMNNVRNTSTGTYEVEITLEVTSVTVA